MTSANREPFPALHAAAAGENRADRCPAPNITDAARQKVRSMPPTKPPQVCTHCQTPLAASARETQMCPTCAALWDGACRLWQTVSSEALAAPAGESAPGEPGTAGKHQVRSTEHAAMVAATTPTAAAAGRNGQRNKQRSGQRNGRNRMAGRKK